MTRLLLVGNPNSGKTTLFNALTGDNQRIGNWPGVTVEQKTGHFRLHNRTFELTDLPGIYSLSVMQHGNQDECVAARAIAHIEADVLLNIIDACHLERHLYLTSQLLELGKPMIVVLNMTDIAQQHGISINTAALSQTLQCPVIALQAHRKESLADLYQALLTNPPSASPLNLPYAKAIQHKLDELEPRVLPHIPHPKHAKYTARRILEGDTILLDDAKRKAILSDDPLDDSDVFMADARYQAIHDIVVLVQTKRSDAKEHFTAKLDRIMLHRFFALPIFFGMMYLTFLCAINLGGLFQDCFNIASEAIFVEGTANVLAQIHAPNWLITVLAHGIGKGINTTLTFIPVMASMFFFLALLETSGYMARAAFVVDKAMRALGLPGKAFVPMIIGFGCNVPAIMAARTLHSERDRILTILMTPFMSCSARLAIYAVFVAAFFPTGGQNIIFSLYLIGIVIAVLTGFLLRKTWLRGQTSPLILELPPYHKPSLRRLWKETNLRLRYFILRAGKFILPICCLLGSLNALPIPSNAAFSDHNGATVLSVLGHWITPLFSPMGLHQDNWPATVGLLSGILSKEVVIGSLNTLYAQAADIIPYHAQTFSLWESLQTAAASIVMHVKQLSSVLQNPLLASAPVGDIAPPIYGALYERFDGPIGAYAYLLFILLYIPCVSTMATIRQETNRKLMWFSIAWSLVIAYSCAVLFYQIATIVAHPQQTIIWTLGIALIIVGTITLSFHKMVGRTAC